MTKQTGIFSESVWTSLRQTFVGTTSSYSTSRVGWYYISAVAKRTHI